MLDLINDKNLNLAFAVEGHKNEMVVPLDFTVIEDHEDGTRSFSKEMLNNFSGCVAEVTKQN